jgi:hypothetical protein
VEDELLIAQVVEGESADATNQPPMKHLCFCQ